MRHYLSSGMGVNSVALHLLMLREGYDFEAIFVDHGADWPETYEYVKLFNEYLIKNGHKKITILTPHERSKEGIIFTNAYEYYKYRELIAVRAWRSCTVKWKLNAIFRYYKKPCFVNIGIDAGEQRRAKISTINGMENRWPLIEYDIDREGCKKIIADAGLPEPPRSACFFCPFQTVGQYKDLYEKHPDLFLKAYDLEIRYNKRRVAKGKEPIYIKNNKPLIEIINEDNCDKTENHCICGL